MTGNIPPDGVTVSGLAAFCGLPTRTVRRHVRTGVIEGARKVGRTWLIPTVEAVLYAETHRQEKS